ncbi:MAG TPA: hypothetical protein VJ723_05185 [Candidatus Angelobacter sp.]|nr:hypothetical protein [Candidatus Angelobacter sp.]
MTEEAKPTQQTTGQLKLKIEDLEKAKQMAGEYTELHELQLQTRTSDTERSMQLNREGASFYEKLAVLDGGVIALFLGFIVSHSAGSHISRGSFWGLFCPAGGLLLFSLLFSGMSIIDFHTTNALMAKNLRVSWSRYRQDRLSNLIGRFSKNVSGEFQFGNETIDYSHVLGGLQLLMKKAASDEDAEMQKQNREWRSGDWKSRIALYCTVIAILLLCIFTVKMLSL